MAYETLWEIMYQGIHIGLHSYQFRHLAVAEAKSAEIHIAEPVCITSLPVTMATTSSFRSWHKTPRKEINQSVIHRLVHFICLIIEVLFCWSHFWWAFIHPLSYKIPIYITLHIFTPIFPLYSFQISYYSYKSWPVAHKLVCAWQFSLPKQNI